MKSERPGIADYALLFALAAIFGSSFMFTRVVLVEVPPLTTAWSRVAIALLALWLLLVFSGRSLPRGRDIWGWILLAAFFGNALPFALISWGQVEVNAGLAAILMAVMPLATVFIADRFTRDEKLNHFSLIGVLCGLLGVSVLVGWQDASELGSALPRQLAVIGGAICYAVHAVISKRLATYARLPMLTALMLAATLWLLPFVLLFDEPLALRPSADAVTGLLMLGLASTALANGMVLMIIARQGAGFLSQVNFLIPLFGVFFGFVFLGERLPANAWLALAIILLGIALVRHGAWRARQA